MDYELRTLVYIMDCEIFMEPTTYPVETKTRRPKKEKRVWRNQLVSSFSTLDSRRVLHGKPLERSARSTYSARRLGKGQEHQIAVVFHFGDWKTSHFALAIPVSVWWTLGLIGELS